jgi:hypothetical protein
MIRVLSEVSCVMLEAMITEFCLSTNQEKPEKYSKKN